MRWFCWHRYDIHQHAIKADGTGLGPPATLVIAWKQCRKCAKSKLIHILV